jgi:hypothetical protein
VPAAAVTPAPIAYINIAAVKKLVVGFELRPVSAGSWYGLRLCRCRASSSRVAGWTGWLVARGATRCALAFWCGGKVPGHVYFEKRRVLKAGCSCLWISVHGIMEQGLAPLFVGFGAPRGND